MSTCILRSNSPLFRSQAGLLHWERRSQALVYRITRPLASPAPSPAPKIIHHITCQTVIHLHHAASRQIFNCSADTADRPAELIVRQAPMFPAQGDGVDPSRPTLMAQRLLRVLSADSAQSVFRPFFYSLFQSFQEQEKEKRQVGPVQPPPAADIGLSGWEFHALVRSVAAILSRDSRLEALRRGRTSEWPI